MTKTVIFASLMFLTLILACNPLSRAGVVEDESFAVAPGPAQTITPAGTSTAGESLTLGLHIGLDTLAEYDYPRGEWLDSEDWEATMRRNLDWVVTAGYDTLLLDVILPEGYLFTSDLLAGQGYNAYPDLLDPFIVAAHARGLVVFADITVLAWRLDPDNQAVYHIQGEPLSVDQVQQVVATLLDDYNVDGIVEETFTSEYIIGIHETCRTRSRPYIHKWDDPVGAYDILMSEDYVGYLDSVAEYQRLDPIGAVANNLGVMNALFTHARALGIPAWVKVYGGWGFSPGASRNVFLLRAVQFQSDGYFWMDFGEEPNAAWVRSMDTADLRGWLDYLRSPSPMHKPIANIYVVHPGTETPSDVAETMDLALIHSFGPISNGLMLAGYDVRTTYDRPLTEAALTVLLVAGGWWDEAMDLPVEVFQVLRGDSSVIVVSATGLAATGRWQEALPLLGISPGWEPDYADEFMPETVEFAGQTVRWRGLGIWGYPAITSLIHPRNVTGEVLLRRQAEGQEVALMVRKGNKVFVNGNLLNLDTGFVFSHLASQGNPALAAPFYGYGVLGTRSAFMAMGETRLQVNLRDNTGRPIEEGTPLRVVRFDADGRLASEEQRGYSAPFRADLARHELLIVEVLAKTAARIYYVGQTGCSDTGSGDVQIPFCTFATAVDRLQAGDTLVIQDGTYTERLKVRNLAGQADALITIRGASRTGTVIDGGCPGFPCSIDDVDRDEWWGLIEWADVAGMVDVQNSSYLVLRDFTVRNAIASGINVYGGGNNVVTNVTVDGTGNPGILLEQTAHITATYNDVGRAQSGFRDDKGNARLGYHEAFSVVAVSDFEVAYNNVHDTLKEGIVVKESSSIGSVHHNTVERACAVGIYIDEAHHVQVHHNRVRRSGYFLADGGQERLCSDHPVFGGDFGQYYGNALLLAVGDLGEASQGKLSDIRIYRNVTWDSHGNGLQFWDEWRESGTGQGQMWDNRIYNNVFYNADLAGIRLDDVISTTVANNIVALNEEEGITGNSLEAGATANTISHNLFHLRHDWQQPVGSDYVSGDPRFVDAANGDFRLQADSPAIDRGMDVGLPYAGSAPDMGAYEYGLPMATAIYLPLLVRHSLPPETRADGAVRLTTSPAAASDQNPAFSPDGTRLVFTRFKNGYNRGPAGLFLLDLNSGAVARLTPAEDQDNVNLPGSAWNAVNGRIVLASDRAEADDLWRIAPDGDDFSRITAHLGQPWHIEPSWSPDGRWLVFEASRPGRSRDGRIGEIWKVRADGSDLTQLTGDPAFDDRQPNWSPLGDRIIFQRRVPNSHDWNLYTMVPDGSDVLTVTTSSADDTDASWSPDGRRIVYSSDYGGLSVANIFVAPATGGAPTRVTFDDGHEDAAPSWSPDGRWIVFESRTGGDEDAPAGLWRIAVPPSVAATVSGTGENVTTKAQRHEENLTLCALVSLW